MICRFIVSATMTPQSLLEGFHRLSVGKRLLFNRDATSRVTTDFGRLIYAVPAAVLQPDSELDIAAIIRLSHESDAGPFPVAARGRGHSTHGQAAAEGGVVVEMRDMAAAEGRLRVVTADQGPAYIDAGAEQLWVDVLRESLRHGLAPRSWTDYLHLTVGGTLSVGGISGQTFRHGPQISNVYQLEVITGKGEMGTCSGDHNADLFHAALGGLGQFGVITRARIALEPAPQRARWIRLMYTDFVKFTQDQEYLISLPDKGFDYVEGSLFLGQSPITSWRSSFYSASDLERINALVRADPHDTLYCLEVVMYYGQGAEAVVREEVEALLRKLNFVPGFVFANDVSYVSFLDRVHDGEMRLREQGQWEVPHPWLNIFVPRSRIQDFDLGVFKGILRHQKPMGPILIYPLNRTKWDERMSAIIPEEEDEIFYSVGLLRSAIGEWKYLEDQNAEIMGFCEQQGIKVKQYMPHYTARKDWIKHFGSKWELFLERKRKYDPKAILSPGQGIFRTSLLPDSLICED